jgi:hypothetical protein
VDYQHFDFSSVSGIPDRDLQSVPSAQATAPQLALVLGSSDFGIKVVGTAKHQAELRLIAGSSAENSDACNCTALLIADPRNPRDPGFVAVRIAGWSIGSLPSEIAPMLNEALVRDGYAAAICAARIVEAGVDAEDDKSKYVVRLSACLPFVLHDVSEVAVPLKTLGQVISTGAKPEEPSMSLPADPVWGPVEHGSSPTVGAVVTLVIAAVAVLGVAALFEYQSQRSIDITATVKSSPASAAVQPQADPVSPSAIDEPVPFPIQAPATVPVQAPARSSTPVPVPLPRPRAVAPNPPGQPMPIGPPLRLK